jgi:hypothetical protein
MIKDRFYSNDKSTVQVLPKNYKNWFYKDKEAFQANKISFGRLMYIFSKFMETKTMEVKHFLPKYKDEYYFKFFMISQQRKPPFGFWINFNYIQYLNNSGFNYIKESSEFLDLVPFIESIIEEYLGLMQEFIQEVRVNWDEIKDSEGNLISEQLFREDINLFEEYVFKSLLYSKEISLAELSITGDIHFSNSSAKNTFFDIISSVLKDNYKRHIVENETVYFNPFNKTLQKIDRNIPKIRFYDKQKDVIFNYFKKKDKLRKQITKTKKEIDYFKEEPDDTKPFERFETVTILSHDEENLETEFIDAYTFLQNTFRFEVDFFSKPSIRAKFGTTNIFKIKIEKMDNLALLQEYLDYVLDVQTTSFKERYFYDMVTKEEKHHNYNKVKIDVLEDSGGLTEKFNIVIKDAEFLNDLNSEVQVNKRNVSSDRSLNSIYSKKRRLRQEGIIKGFGKKCVLNEPYKSLLMLYNIFQNYNLLTKEVKHLFEPRAEQADSKAAPAKTERSTLR